MTSTFRADTRDGLVTAVDAFITAHPTLLYKMHRRRPTRYSGDLPFAFAEILSETATHDSGLRTRTLTPSVVVVLRPVYEDDPADDVDDLVDLLADHFTTYAHFSSNTVWDRWTVTEESEDVTSETGTFTYPSVRFTFDNLTAREGRP